MDIRQLHYFITTVEEKTVTAAAKKLHMTQPPLTMQIHALEEELGCRLFRREGRTLVPTDAGKRFYKRASEVLGMCENIKEEMSDYKKGNAGTLRIGVISSVRGTLFTNSICEFHKKYPNVKISIHSANTYQLLESLQNNKIDIAITRTPFSAAKLDIQYLSKERISALGHKKYFKNVTSENLSMAELSKMPLIVYRRWQKIIEAAFEAHGYSPNIYCINDDAGMTLLLAEKGLGVGLLHPSAIGKIISSDMSSYELSEKSLISEIALVCRNRELLPEPAQLFWDLLKDKTVFKQ